MTTTLRKAGVLALLVLGAHPPALRAGGKASRFACAATGLGILTLLQVKNAMDASAPAGGRVQPLAERGAETGRQGDPLDASSTGFSLPPEWFLQPSEEIVSLPTDPSLKPVLAGLPSSTRPLVQNALALFPGRECRGRTWSGESPLPPFCQDLASPGPGDAEPDPEAVVASLGDPQVLERHQGSARLLVAQFFQCICRTLDAFVQAGGKGGEAALAESLEHAVAQRNAVAAGIRRQHQLLQVMWRQARENPELWKVPEAGVPGDPVPYPMRIQAIEAGIREMESGKRTFDLVIKPALAKVRRHLRAAAKAKDRAREVQGRPTD